MSGRMEHFHCALDNFLSKVFIVFITCGITLINIISKTYPIQKFTVFKCNLVIFSFLSESKRLLLQENDVWNILIKIPVIGILPVDDVLTVICWEDAFQYILKGGQAPIIGHIIQEW